MSGEFSSCRYFTKFWISGIWSSTERSRGVLPSSMVPMPSRMPQSTGSWSVTIMLARPQQPSTWDFEEPRLPAGSSELPVRQAMSCRARVFCTAWPVWSGASW